MEGNISTQQRKVYMTDHIHRAFKKFVLSRSPDVLFIFDGKNGTATEQIPAHKEVLAASSSVFEKMFFGDLKEEGKVSIVDASAAAFKEFLQLFYEKDVTLTMENIEEVVQLADKYDVTEGLRVCEHFLERHLTDENVIWELKLAAKFRLNAAIDLCKKAIGKNLQKYLDSSDFLECDHAALNAILQIPTHPFELFDACLKWAKAACANAHIDANDPRNIREKLGDSFRLIRFSEMTTDQLANMLSSNRGLIPLNCLEIAFLRAVPCQNEAVVPASFSKFDWFELRDDDGLVFSLSTSMLLSDIFCSSLYRDDDDSLKFSFLLSIEKQKQKFVTTNYDCNSSSDIIMQQNVILRRQVTKIELPVPITIIAGHKYTISFKYDNGSLLTSGIEVYCASDLKSLSNELTSNVKFVMMDVWQCSKLVHSLNFKYN